MYLITVTAKNRYAEFLFDETTKILTRTMRSSMNEEIRGDILTVTISESCDLGNVEEKWLYLSGTPREIMKAMDEKYPIVKLKSNRLFDILNKVNADDTIAVVYSPTPLTGIFRDSTMYRVLKACQTAIIEKTFDLNEGTVEVL